MEAYTWLGVIKATPQRPLPSLLSPQRPGRRKHRVPSLLQDTEHCACQGALKHTMKIGHLNYTEWSSLFEDTENVPARKP